MRPILYFTLFLQSSLFLHSFEIKKQISILCYHGVSKQVSETSLKVSLQKFQQQMSWLSKRGYKTALAQDLNGKIREKQIIISFDVPGQDFLTLAKPVLDKYKFKVVLFALPKGVQKKYRDFLTKAQLQTLQSEGHMVLPYLGSKTVPLRLDRYTQESYLNKIKKNFAKAKLRADYVAYSYGGFNSDTISKLKELGFKGAFTVFLGNFNNHSNQYLIPRYLVLPEHNLKTFASRLSVSELPILDVNIKPGSYFKNRELLKVRLPKGLSRRNLHAEIGDQLIGYNTPARFEYNSKSGLLKLYLKKQSADYVIVRFRLIQEKRQYQSSLLYVAKKW